MDSIQSHIEERQPIMSNKKMINFIAKSKHIFIGLEDSKRSWKVAVRCEGTLVDQTSMPAVYSNLIGYLHNKFPDCTIELIYEAGFHGFWLHDLLAKDGIKCIVVPPHTVTEEKAHRVKTDRIDARRMAKNLENGDYKSCCVPDPERLADRQISRTLEDLQQDIVRTRNRIWRFFDFHGITVPITSSVPTEKDIRNLRMLELLPHLKTSLKVYLDLLDTLWQMRKTLRNQLRSISQKSRYKKTFEIIRSVPGFGWYTAIRLVLEWGEDLSRFKGKRQIASFVGLCGSENSTGDTVRRGHLTGLGHKRSRSWIVENTWISIRKDPVLRDKFQRVYRNTGSKKKAIVAAARKLLGRILRCVLNQEEYAIGLVGVNAEIA